jgi:hypothetical protein
MHHVVDEDYRFTHVKLKQNVEDLLKQYLRYRYPYMPEKGIKD